MQEWTRETTKNIELCKQEIKCGMSLRSYVEILFKQVVEDISNQFNRTNESFRTRMEEIRYMKMKLEGLHCGTANQVNKTVPFSLLCFAFFVLFFSPFLFPFYLIFNNVFLSFSLFLMRLLNLMTCKHNNNFNPNNKINEFRKKRLTI